MKLVLKLDNIIELKTEKDIDSLIELNSSLDKSDKVRIKADFRKGYFKGLFLLDNKYENNSYSLDSILSYALYYNSYSSWQNRVLYLAELWTKPELSDELKYSILKLIREKLFSIARSNNYQRVNFNVREIEENKKLVEWLVNEEIGALNLSRLEDWYLFELGHNEMKEFLKHDLKLESNYKIIKVSVEDMHKYSIPIRDQIKEISIFEKMEDQFKTSLDGLINDYVYDNHVSYDNQASLNRFYEAMVVIKQDFNEATKIVDETVVGYSLYYLSYDLKRGLGCYLEDLYIQEKYRRNGLGTFLWFRVIDDCLNNLNANFMQWSVLAWNQPAIELYFKYKSINLTDIYKLNLYRFTTDKIYA